MRRYAVGIQLALLVCGGAASGYLWRAALERGGTTIRYVTAGQPYEPTTLRTPRLQAPALAPAKPVRSTHRRHVRAATPTPVAAKPAERPVASTPLASVTVRPAVAHPTLRTPAAPRPRPVTRPHPAPKPTSPPAVSPPPPPPPSPPAPPVAAPPTSVAPIPSRPGWGNGDKNHVHTGPPGQAKGNGKK